MKLTWLMALLVALLGLALWLHLSGDDGRRTAPPSMTAVQILETPDFQLISLVTTDVRWKLAELPSGDFYRWRTLPVAARMVFILSFVERDAGPGVPPIFDGFASLLNATRTLNGPTLTEIAEAYMAIGAPASAEVVLQAAKRAEFIDVPTADSTTDSTAESTSAVIATPPRLDSFADVDQELLTQSRTGGVIALLRAYIRSHASEIAASRIGG